MKAHIEEMIELIKAAKAGDRQPAGLKQLMRDLKAPSLPLRRDVIQAYLESRLKDYE